jgi:membrane protein YdbS with pleckstrin-like domain
MSQHLEQVSKWFYQGVWGVLTRWFRVPAEPPVLPTAAGEPIKSFRPAEGFLQYLKLQFWIGTFFFCLIDLIVWVILVVAVSWLGLLLLPVALFVAGAPAILAYLAIHLRFDTTWYVVSDRSMRLRRGIWVIQETTITFENVQNVTVNQGPLQRFFRIADVVVQTAGGGGATAHGHQGGGSTGAHVGLIEGVANAAEIRDMIMKRLKASRFSGIGDESPATATTGGWTPAQIAALREIREAVRQLVPN